MNLSDQQKKIIAGAIALVAVLVIVFVLVRGRRPALQAGAAGGGFPQGGEQVAAGPGPAGAAGAAGAAGGGAQAPAAAGGGGAGAAAEAPAGPTQYPTIGVVKMGIGPAEPTRPDPFLTFNPPIPPVPAEVLYPLPAVGLVAGGLRPGGPGERVATVGNRRVAGLLFNDQAYAILEDEEGRTYIVKPGDVVEGIKIVAISRDSIFLRDREGRKWEVPLRGLGPGGEATAAETTASAPAAMPPV
ncbi:MAG: hypothetical protein ACE149_12135 [Armatimonadota bacterium]